MGLLSDPEYGSLRWVRILKKFHGLFSNLCVIGGVVWFLLLACKEFNNETYFSENALLPGLATNEFMAERAANQYHNEFLQELEDKYENDDQMPVPWLVAKMSQLHLEVHTHNFTLNYPLGNGQVFKGTNVYGILRAPRASSLEALVISVPYRPLSSFLKGTTAGVALMLAFAEFARPQKYWAKDIIFLVTEHEQLGMQAWLEAYHGVQSDPGNFYSSLGSFYKPGMPTLDLAKLIGFQLSPDQSKCLDPGKLSGRSGSIQAAINLELQSPKFKYVAVKVEGLNGQLPNLDLVNLVLKLCLKAGIHHSFQNSYSWMRNRYKLDTWFSGFRTMMKMALEQLSGAPNGNHGLFHRFGIEAVTLDGRNANDEDPPAPKVNALSSANFYQLGIALESIMRSMNNLLERFHQSYFFYLLTATNRFISIGQYMPSLCLMCVAFLIRALGFWVTIQKDSDNESDAQAKEGTQETEKDSKKEKATEKPAEKVKGDSDIDEETSERVPGDKELRPLCEEEKGDTAKGKAKRELSFSVVNIGANYILVHLLGYLTMCSPFILSRIGAAYMGMSSEKSIYYGLIGISVVAAALVPLFPRLFRSGPVTREELTLTNILVLLELATASLAIGMHNYPLGFFFAAYYSPLVLTIRAMDANEKWSWMSLVRRALCVAYHPLAVCTAAALLYGKAVYPEDTPAALVARAANAVMQGLMFSVVDFMMFGNWLFNVAALVVIPAWLLLWQLATVPAALQDGVDPTPALKRRRS